MGNAMPYESATARLAVACPEGKEKRSGSTIAVGLLEWDGRPRAIVRFTSCTKRWEITRLARANRESRSHSQQPTAGNTAAASVTVVPPKWVTAHQVRCEARELGRVAQRSISARS